MFINMLLKEFPDDFEKNDMNYGLNDAIFE